jgi:tetratricopeptide (TPR) repeat protein
VTLRDYHSLTWLTYVYLQQSRYSKAEELIALMRGALKESDDMRMRRTYIDMATMFTFETERWDSLAKLLADATPAGASPTATPQATGEHAHGAASTPASPPAASQGYGRGGPRIAFARGMAAASKGNFADADKYIGELQAIRKGASETGDGNIAKLVEIMELEVSAVASAGQGKSDDAIERLKKAVALEESLSPPSGPPDVIKPSHELFGEILLRAGRPKEAARQFARALERQPNRARSLLGAAKAAEQSGPKAAAQ